MKKKIMILCALLGMLAMLLCVAVGYAYFSKEEIYQGLMGAEIELLFERLDETALTTYQTEVLGLTDTVEGNTDNWGSRENPYVIANIKHLYNLAELQRLGYFERNYISKNGTTNEDGTVNGYDIIPYFLICDTEGKPTVIDGSTFGGTISTVGTEEYPFIGSVKGAFVEGDCRIAGVTRASDTSMIYKVTVKSDPEDVDAGLFGYVGYIKDPSSTGEAFAGTVSELSDLVLYDVTVKVDSSLWDKAVEFLEEHIFSFSDTTLTDEDRARIPHENHHIGILAGHVDYTKVSLISVYYSSDSIAAIELSDDRTHTNTVDANKAANYMSVSGIIGFMSNMNPEVDENGNISAGSGTNNSDLSYSTVGGGGLASGLQAGYVKAVDFYTAYGYNPVEDGDDADAFDDDGRINIYNAMDADGTPLCTEWVRQRLLWGTEATGRYYFYDGVFTFALSSTEDVIEDTWNALQDRYFGVGLSGGDWNANWETNYTKGNAKVTAFIRPITNDAELYEAIHDEGKQIFIMSKNADGTSGYTMTLYDASTGSTGDVEEKYSVSGTGLTLKNYTRQADREYIDSVIQTLTGGDVELSDDITAEYRDAQTLANALQSGELTVIDVGNTTSDMDLAALKAQYRVWSSWSGAYKYYSGDNIMVPAESTALNTYAVTDVYDYFADPENEGYYYYTTEVKTSFLIPRTYYHYHWISKDGVDTLLSEEDGTRTAPDEYFTAVAEAEGVRTAWQGERLFVRADGSNGGLAGVLINEGDALLFVNDLSNPDTGTPASSTGTSLTKNGTEQYAVFYYKVTEERASASAPYTYYRYHVSTKQEEAVSLSPAMENGVQKTTDAGIPLYTDGTSEGVLIARYPAYKLFNGSPNSNQPEQGASNPNYLRILSLSYQTSIIGITVPLGTFYPLWNGLTDTLKTASSFQHTFGVYSNVSPTLTNGSIPYSDEATIVFNADGSCTIGFSVGTVTRYLACNGTSFLGSASNVASSTVSPEFYMYSVEGTQDLNYGRVTYDPVTSNADKAPTEADPTGNYAVDQYVLFAQSAQPDANGAAPADSSLYTVVRIEDLNWSEKDGVLSPEDLAKKFTLREGINFGININLGGGSLPLSDGILQAPVGSNGVEATIPEGCVAFQINKDGVEQRIRVIVAVSTSEYYVGEEGGDNAAIETFTRYFSLWQLSAAGEELATVFQADETLDRFIVPRSYPYQPGDTPSAHAGETVRVNVGSVVDGTVTPGATEYACYPNGDRILVAYEFTVTGAGIYVLGASSSDENNIPPMEIVYFSADGTASTGRDGNGGSQMGTIDFVYADEANDRIVTVTETYATDKNGAEDYTTYYPSFCILYFDNSINKSTEQNTYLFPAIHDANVYVRRWVDTASEQPIRSTVTMKVTSGTQAAIDDKHVKMARYARLSDILNATYG